jgi:hypothetical protein
VGSGGAYNFGVDSTGTLYATGANISGKITAESGQVAGWEINKNSLTKGTLGRNGVHLYAETDTQTNYNVGQHFGSEEDKQWMLGIGSNFGVTHEGVLYAQAGKIGNLEIDKIASK